MKNYSERDTKLTFTKLIDELPSVRTGYASLGKNSFAKEKYRDYDFTREEAMEIISGNNLLKKVELSNYFFRVDGIYRRLIIMAALMPTFDTLIVPNFSMLPNERQEDAFLQSFNKNLIKIENMDIQGEMYSAFVYAMRDGYFYGVARPLPNGNVVIQELPYKYCSVVGKDITGKDLIEFDLAFFDNVKPNYVKKESKAIAQLRLLNQFPEDIKEAFLAFRRTKKERFVLIEPDVAFGLPSTPDKIPPFLNIIPDLITLNEIKGVQTQKDKSAADKIISHTLPIDKDGELIFSLEEAADFHEAMAQMLQKKNPHITLLTSFGKLDMLNATNDRKNAGDDLEKNERSVMNTGGIAEGVINSSGQVSAGISLNYMWSIIENLLSRAAKNYNIIMKANKILTGGAFWEYSFRLPPINRYNRTEANETARANAALGHNKTMVSITAGVSQMDMFNLAILEKDYLQLSVLLEVGGSAFTGGASAVPEDGKVGGNGRPEEDTKSDKTIANTN